MNIKKIFVLLLFVVAIAGIITPVNSANPPYFIEEGTFKVNGGDTFYYTAYGYSKNKVNKNELDVNFFGSGKKGKVVNKFYLLKKTKKNQIKAYSATYYQTIYDTSFKPKYKFFKTYTTSKNLKNFYYSTFKKYGVNQMKNSFKK